MKHLLFVFIFCILSYVLCLPLGLHFVLAQQNTDSHDEDEGVSRPFDLTGVDTSKLKDGMLQGNRVGSDKRGGSESGDSENKERELNEVNERYSALLKKHKDESGKKDGAEGLSEIEQELDITEKELIEALEKFIEITKEDAQNLQTSKGGTGSESEKEETEQLIKEIEDFGNDLDDLKKEESGGALGEIDDLKRSLESAQRAQHSAAQSQKEAAQSLTSAKSGGAKQRQEAKEKQADAAKLQSASGNAVENAKELLKQLSESIGQSGDGKKVDKEKIKEASEKVEEIGKSLGNAGLLHDEINNLQEKAKNPQSRTSRGAQKMMEQTQQEISEKQNQAANLLKSSIEQMKQLQQLARELKENDVQENAKRLQKMVNEAKSLSRAANERLADSKEGETKAYDLEDDKAIQGMLDNMESLERQIQAEQETMNSSSGIPSQSASSRSKVEELSEQIEERKREMLIDLKAQNSEAREEARKASQQYQQKGDAKEASKSREMMDKADANEKRLLELEEKLNKQLMSEASSSSWQMDKALQQAQQAADQAEEAQKAAASQQTEAAEMGKNARSYHDKQNAESAQSTAQATQKEAGKALNKAIIEQQEALENLETAADQSRPGERVEEAKRQMETARQALQSAQTAQKQAGKLQRKIKNLQMQGSGNESEVKSKQKEVQELQEKALDKLQESKQAIKQARENIASADTDKVSSEELKKLAEDISNLKQEAKKAAQQSGQKSSEKSNNKNEEQKVPGVEGVDTAFETLQNADIDKLIAESGQPQPPSPQPPSPQPPSPQPPSPQPPSPQPPSPQPPSPQPPSPQNPSPQNPPQQNPPEREYWELKRKNAKDPFRKTSDSNDLKSGSSYSKADHQRAAQHFRQQAAALNAIEWIDSNSKETTKETLGADYFKVEKVAAPVQRVSQDNYSSGEQFYMDHSSQAPSNAIAFIMDRVHSLEEETALSKTTDVESLSYESVNSGAASKSSKWEKAAREQQQTKAGEKETKIDKWLSYKEGQVKEGPKINE